MHIKKITLENYKAIGSCELTDLKQINVICGKNNSGKSSVLEAVKNYQKRKDIQIELPADDIRKHLVKIHNSTNPANGLELDKIRRLFDKIINNHDSFIVYSNLNGFNKFYQDLAIKIGIRVLNDEEIKRYTNIPEASEHQDYENFDILKDIYDRILNIDTELIAIPSKRNPNINMSLGNTIPTTFDFEKSYDLIYFLFYSKNQPFDTKDFKKYVELKDIFKEITDGYDFDISYTGSKDGKETLRLNLKFSSDKEKWFDADQSGLGLRDLLVILSYIVLLDKKIIQIEEPENHLHAEMQRKLLAFFKENEDKQFFITTHSNVFLDITFVDRIFQTTMSDGKIIVTDATNKANILQDLGYSVFDNLISDLVILVEGPSDKPILEEFLLKMGFWGKYNIKIWALGGDIMDQQDLSVFKEKSNLIALIDKDPKSRKIRNRFIKNCQNANIEVTKLKKYSIENYFTLDAFRKVFGSQVPATLISIDPNKKVEIQIGFDCKSRTRNLTREMQLSDIYNTDLYEFLEKVKDICEKNLPHKNSKTEIEKI